jgi:predicted ATPase
MKKANGNLFLAGQLLNNLKEQQVFKIIFGRVILSPNVDFKNLKLPDDLQGVIISRIDRLPPSHALILKVASVVGIEFRNSILLALLEGENADDLPSQLQELEALAFIQSVAIDQEEEEEDPLYMFSHISMQEVLYNLMLFSQRRVLHGAVARYLEGKNDGSYAMMLQHLLNSLEEGVRISLMIDSQLSHRKNWMRNTL